MPTTTATLTQAREAAATAQQALDDALTTGKPSQPHRERLATALGRLAALEAAATTPARDETAEAAREKAAAALLTEAVASLQSKLSAFQPPPPPAPALPLGVALQVVLARQEDARDRAALEDHTAHAGHLQDRLTAVRAAREELLSRRLAGQEKPTDAENHALLAADEAGLMDLLDRHQAQRPPEPSREARAVAMWTATMREEYLGALLAYAQNVQGTLLATASELARQSRETRHRLKVDPRLLSAGQHGVI